MYSVTIGDTKQNEAIINQNVIEILGHLSMSDSSCSIDIDLAISSSLIVIGIENDHYAHFDGDDTKLIKTPIYKSFLTRK